MSGHAAAEGALTVPGDPAAVVAAIAARWPETCPRPEEPLYDLLTDVGHLDTAWPIAGTPGAFQVVCDGPWSWVREGLANLSSLGATGELVFRGDDGTCWKTVLTSDGHLEHYPGRTLFTSQPGSDTEVTVLSRQQARALLALAAGDHVDGLEDAVAALVAATN